MREVPIVKRVKVNPAGSATAGVSVSFFIFQSQTSSKCNTSRTQFFFGGGALSLSQYFGTHTSHTMACTQLVSYCSTCVIGGGMRTYSSSGLVAATAIYVLVATYLLGHTAVVAS